MIMIFDVILTLCLLFFSLSVAALFFIMGYLAHEGGAVQKKTQRTKKEDGWENILNYNHRREEDR